MVRIASSINHQLIDGEVVAIDLVTGTYYSLRGTAAAIWERIASAVDREVIIAEAASVWGGSEAAAIARFFDELESQGLVARAPSPSTEERRIPTLPLPQPFAPPLLEKFTDMQDLLLLDPIHEVDQIGWPHKPS